MRDMTRTSEDSALTSKTCSKAALDPKMKRPVALLREFGRRQLIPGATPRGICPARKSSRAPTSRHKM